MIQFHRTACTALCLGALAMTSAAAQPADTSLATRSLAATCAACHGTDGAAVSGAGIKALRGLDRQYIVDELNAFRNGTRPATVMQQIAKGYTPAQIDTLAAYFAGLPRSAP
ncbi:MAG: c-type cytochrome [Rhizobacter sp.]|nr:c-type cytochrome [Rhizobacter sp.]